MATFTQKQLVEAYAQAERANDYENDKRIREWIGQQLGLLPDFVENHITLLALRWRTDPTRYVTVGRRVVGGEV